LAHERERVLAELGLERRLGRQPGRDPRTEVDVDRVAPRRPSAQDEIETPMRAAAELLLELERREAGRQDVRPVAALADDLGGRRVHLYLERDARVGEARGRPALHGRARELR